MKLKLLLYFLLVEFAAHSQANVEWYNYPGGVSVATNSTYDVYTVDWDFNPAGDITLTKRDSSGAILWDTAYDNTDPSTHEVATWVETDNSGNIIVSGTIRSGISNPVNAASLLMKFDSAGTLLWRVVYESSFDGSSTKKILVDSNDNIYALGLGIGPNGMVTKVKKFDAGGTAVWSYFDTTGIGSPLNIKFTPDNNLLIIARGVTGSANGFSKIDLNGNVIWSLAPVSSNTIGDAAGDAFGNTYLVNGEYVISNSGSVIQKLSPGGTQIWADTNSITAFRVEVGTDNFPVICGFPNSGTPGASFIKYNDNGIVLWQNLDGDGPLYALLLHAQMGMDINNAIYLAAGTLTQMALCKISSAGISEWTLAMPGSYSNGFDFRTNDVIYLVGGTTAKISQNVITATSQQTPNESENNIRVFPNPFQGKTNLEFISSTRSNTSVSIYDMAGRKIQYNSTEELDPGKITITLDMSEFTNGVYFCIIQSGETKRRIKLVKN